MQIVNFLMETGTATTSRGFWLMPVVISTIAALRLVALGSRVQVAGDQLIFKPALPVRLIILMGSGFAFAVVIATWHGAEIWQRTTLVIMAFGILVGLPATIVLDTNGIKRKSWWLPSTFIPWTDVVALEENAAGDHVIYGRHQAPITFSRFNTDPHRFKSEVTTRAHLSADSDYRKRYN